MSEDPSCRRCGRPVTRFRDQYETFEGMHWVCFHYEFEHDPQDPDEACNDLTCPSKQLGDRLPVVEKETRLASTVALLTKDLEGRFLILDTAPADLCAVNIASRDDPRRSVYISTLGDDDTYSYELEEPPEEPDMPYSGHGMVGGVTYGQLLEAVTEHLRL